MMPVKLLLAIFVLQFAIVFIANGQAVDSTKRIQQPVYSDTALISKTGNNYADDDLPPALFFLFFGLATFALAFLCIGVGIAVVLIGALTIFGLVSLGLLSTSIIVGLHKKSFSLGFKMFLLLSLSIIGITIGLAGSYLLNKVFQLHFTNISVITVGAVSGLIGGLLLGQLVYIMTKKLTSYFKQRLQLV